MVALERCSDDMERKTCWFALPVATEQYPLHKKRGGDERER